MPKFEVSFTVETDDKVNLDEMVDRSETDPSACVLFHKRNTFTRYCIPASSVVKRVVPPFEYGYWRHKGTGAVYKIVEAAALKSAIERNPDEWERVSVEALADA